MAEADATTFWDHLDALRGVLFRVVAVVLVIGIGSFVAMPWLFEHVIMAPCRAGFPTYALFDKVAALFGEPASATGFAVDIVSLELASQLFIHLSSACWVALLVAFPIIIYLLWGFVSPALYEHEKRYAVSAFVFGNLMFYLGVAVAYFLVVPLTVRFLAGYTLSPEIRPMVSLDSYMDNFFTMLILMGAVFELPLLAHLLGRAGIVNRRFFSRYRRHAIVVLLIVAAMITPTGDPFTLFIVFIPIYALWELSARLVPAPPADDDCD